MVAQYADESNLVGIGPDQITRKLDVLAAHCERLGRDRSEITVTAMAMCNVAPTMEEADADLRAVAAAKGWNDETVEMLKGMLVHGDPDTVGEALEAYMATGLDGLTLNAAGQRPRARSGRPAG